MISNLVLDPLFARRPKIRYISPPVCGLIQSPTSSGLPSVSLETISPLQPVHYFFDIVCGLSWDPYPHAICYNVYRSNLGSVTFLGIVECGDHTCMPVSPGCYAVTAVTPDGETPFGQPICTQTVIPPCVPPTAPNNVTFGEFAQTSTTLSIEFNQPINTGSDIVSYTIKVGTVSGGPYTIVVTVDNATRIYTLTGLTASTTYFGIVIANGAECSSAASAESSGTTSAPMLSGAYWSFEDFPPADAAFPGPAKNVANPGTDDLLVTGADGKSLAGIIGLGFKSTASATWLAHPDDSLFGVGPGKSFSIVTWAIGVSGQHIQILGKWNASPSPLQDYALLGDPASFITFYAYDLSGALQTVGSVFFSTGAHFFAMGYDDALQQIWLQADGGPRVSAACVGVRRTAADFWMQNNNILPFPAGVPNVTDETGITERSLTVAEITDLWNGGAGRTFPNAIWH